MTPYYADDWLTIHQGDVRDVLPELASDSVDCIVTSPPYWGLRDYGTASWDGGDPACDHKQETPVLADSTSTLGVPADGGQRRIGANNSTVVGKGVYRHTCGKCGAVRQDSQIGLERTPEEYVANLVDVFRELRRILKPSGTCWLNLGDSYAAGGKGGGGSYMAERKAWQSRSQVNGWRSPPHGLKPKDLVGIPWRVAFALQQPYYVGRIAQERDRVWMAAMLDAEGTICGFRHERPDANVRTGMLVFITNSDTRVLDEADRIWPGARYLDHNRAGDDMGHGIIATRDSWRWQIQKAHERSAFVRELYPYLISKKQQAMVAWNLLEFTKAALRMGRGGESADTKTKRDVLVGLLSDLNHARPVVTPSWIKEPPTLLEPGWYLRSDIVWSKSNPMPESVTDRPTKAHEYLFLLTKSARYYYDADAVAEQTLSHPSGNGFQRDERISGNLAAGDPKHWTPRVSKPRGSFNGKTEAMPGRNAFRAITATRNLRSVWTIATRPYPGAHFAVFPPELPERCIKAGSSERGVCPDCGAPWERVVERPAEPDGLRNRGNGAKLDYHTRQTGSGQKLQDWMDANPKQTTGWQPTCRHQTLKPEPATIFDPFAGSGTTGMVANRLSRRAILIDLNGDYLKQQLQRNAQTPLGLATA